MVGEEGGRAGAKNGVYRLENGLLYGSCVWQHEAARQDARVVRETVADNRGEHSPCWLVRANGWCVVEHVPDGCGKCGSLCGPLGYLAGCLGASGVQVCCTPRARFGA